MKFGISFLPDVGPSVKSSRQYFEEALELSCLADRSGLDYVKMTEHYIGEYGGYCPNPIAFLSAVAGLTKSIRLITGGILASFHHPIKIASDTAMLDAISGGRLDVGFARAYLPYEFEAFGIALDESRERFQSTIDMVIKLWKQDSVTSTIPFFPFRNVQTWPSPTQKPHPPLWGAAVRSRESFSWLGEQGFGLLVTGSPGATQQLKSLIEIYREAFQPREGAIMQSPIVAMSVPLCISFDEHEAIELGSRYLDRYLSTWRSAVVDWATTHSSAYPGYSHLYDLLKSTTGLDLIRKNNALVGNPESIVRKIKELSAFFGIDCWLWQIDFGGSPLEIGRKTLNLFVEYVLPSFAENGAISSGMLAGT